MNKVLVGLRFLCFLWLSVLAADLLYLYYAGGWYDPFLFIEELEVAILYFFVVLGTAMATLEIFKMAEAAR